ncbi:MAG: DUF1080 domain-containing protein [Isosphaeraceae bacterium]
MPQARLVCALLLVLGSIDVVPVRADDNPYIALASWTPLFDGSSLQGWKRMGGKAEAWGVENGCLVSFGEGGGWLGTERTYRDFELSLAFKVSAGSNSGIYLRAPADTSHISRTGMEIQILDGTHPRHKGIKDWQKTGALYHVAAPKPGHEKPVGEWNTLVIRADGPHLTIHLNGALIVDDRLDRHPELDAEHPGLKRADGLIGLQSHNGRVDFKDIKVRILPTKLVPAR